MKICFSLAALAGMASLAQAHMQMSWPPPFRSKFNKYTTDIDYSMTSPLFLDGGNYPCKGYHSALNTSQGQSVVNWEAGQTNNFTIVGTATHAGGSCQASLSFDQGKTWKVIHSYISQCPLKSSWQFTLPNDTPSGDALFAWSWFNQLGNREMYMNCAHVTIRGGTSVIKERSAADSISKRPAIFVANVANVCGTLEGADVVFPQPGPDVDRASGKTSPPVGNCG
ncbi:hypothetical protein TOPH_08165 [Tolypocladium ophioglossoides CBS 100239]|uniref:Extracellular protein n=1 Tax=Tolypocladium ophioglossoides (strain CBS 100239) TaxID=1163406 RepID=A0A0L0N085_TOLOC|nr:hypothetical protein TOPH_08165 [Tolypocladium ophioglossoides CBS 100239]